jgi:hypothetical protein
MMGTGLLETCREVKKIHLKQCVKLVINTLYAELNPICHLLALLGGAIIVVVNRLRVNKNYYEMDGQRNIKHFCLSLENDMCKTEDSFANR